MKQNPLPPPESAICDETVVFVGIFASIWGHEITDNLKHFWFLFDEKYAHLKNLPFVFAMLWEKTKTSDNFLCLLERLGIPKEKLRFIAQPTRFKKVFVPEECFFLDPLKNACLYTKEYLYFFKLLKTLAVPNLNVEKIYLSRSKLPRGKDFNEISLENFFKKQGFTIIHPEKNTFLENLAIFQNTQVFAATDGSIAHNLIFCNNGIKAIICRKSRHFTTHQMTINFLKNADVVYIDTAFSPFADCRKKSWVAGPFFLYESNALRRYFNLPPKKFPIKEFLSAIFLFFYSYIDNHYFAWSHPMRAKLQIGTKLRRLFK